MPPGKPTSSQPDLTLLVQQEGRIDQEVFLQHGITIGRAASNTVCIEDSEVEHIHARVLRQADGSFILQAEDRATFQAVSSEDGSTQTTDKAALQADLVLQIGKTKITCRKQKSHAGAILAESLWEAACPRCQSVISDQAQAEQTCSSCSLPLFRHESKEFTGWLPRKVGPYEIRKFVAKGGMGVVLRGIHEENDQVAAIKLPHPELVKDERWARRFEGEIKTLERAGHRRRFRYHPPDVHGVGDLVRDPATQPICSCHAVRTLQLARGSSVCATRCCGCGVHRSSGRCWYRYCFDAKRTCVDHQPRGDS